MKKITTLLVLFITVNLLAQIPAGYYDSATGTGVTLKTSLHNIIKTNSQLSYSQVWEALKYTDEDPNNSSNVILLYTGWSYPKNDNGGGVSEWNREHTWAKSHGDFGTAIGPGTDIHHLRPTDVTVNSKRSNLHFDAGGSPYSDPTRYGMSGSFDTGCKYDGDSWEPRDEVKGDVARMIFYMAVRYEGDDNYPDLEVVDYIPSNNSSPEHGLLSTLIQWHNNDPVSSWEQRRNDRIYYGNGTTNTYAQWNRNPFIDHPEWVNAIWGGSMDTTAPSVPTNLVASNPTSSTIDLSWTASTDDTAVTSYDIYRDGVQTYNTTNTTFTANGLQGETTYCFTIKARDAANNVSNASNQSCETTLAGSGGTGICTTETFENIPANSSSYNNRTWSSDNGLTWSATNARTDQTINNRAITIENGVLTAPTTTGGIGELTVTTQRKYSGGTGSYDLKVNGVLKGTIPYGSTAQTTTITAINIENNVTITLSKTASSDAGDRVAFDDLSWTCYSAAAGVETTSLANITIYPNPIKDGYFTIHLNEKSILTFYTILGEVVQTKTVTAGLQTVTVNKLTTGFYLLKIQNSKGMAVRKIKVD